MKKYIITSLGFLAVPLLAFALTVSNDTSASVGGNVCTMDAKLCPDGSYVGRSGPACEFAACPGEFNTTRCYAFERDLYVGLNDARTGGDASLLQAFLLSYLKLSPTGYFGPLTFNAVTRFQIANGVRATGYVGPLTRARIKALTCGGSIPTVGLPTLQTLSPSAGIIGTTVTLFGQNLQGDATIIFGGYRITPNNGTTNKLPNQISFTIPARLENNCPPGAYCLVYLPKDVTPGKYDVAVETKAGTSNALSFEVLSPATTPAPTITSISPASGPTGTKVSVYGDFNPTTDYVTFSGMTERPILGESTAGKLVFTVPQQQGPDCSNPRMACPQYIRYFPNGKYDIAVVTPRGTSNSVVFEITGNGQYLKADTRP